jgi:long-chain-fatty-acid--CoA ligase ACSBG
MAKHIALRETKDFRITQPSMPVRIFQNPRDKTASVDPITIPALMNRTVDNYGNHPALKFKDTVTGKWQTITYREYKERVEKMAKVFIKLGLERYGSVAVLAFNSVEWFVSELAAIHAGYVYILAI